MAEDASSHPARLIHLTGEADADRTGIYLYTLQQWGRAQAEDYRLALNEVLFDLADDPTRAPLVDGLNQVRSYTLKRRGARQGHRIFYEASDERILILRILHTARNWEAALPEETQKLNAKIRAERAKR